MPRPIFEHYSNQVDCTVQIHDQYVRGWSLPSDSCAHRGQLQEVGLEGVTIQEKLFSCHSTDGLTLVQMSDKGRYKHTVWVGLAWKHWLIASELNTYLANLWQKLMKYFLAEERVSLSTGTVLRIWLPTVVTYGLESPTDSTLPHGICEDVRVCGCRCGCVWGEGVSYLDHCVEGWCTQVLKILYQKLNSARDDTAEEGTSILGNSVNPISTILWKLN